jgi:predicted Rossmann-fold nucleotide-binding protein
MHEDPGSLEQISLAIERKLKQKGLCSSLAVLGSSRITPKGHLLSHYNVMAENFAYRWSDFCVCQKLNYCLCSGGGPGIMEAVHRGAERAKVFSFSLPVKNATKSLFLKNGLCGHFVLHDIAQRKCLLWRWAMAAIFFPGGLGTLDELCDLLEKRFAGEVDSCFPVILVGTDFWKSVLSFEACLRFETIASGELENLHYIDSPEELIHCVIGITQGYSRS